MASRDTDCKKVMILGASFLQVPMIRTANALGLQTVVVDRDPSSPGAHEAWKFVHVSTTDIEGVLKVARKEGLSGITTAATDKPVRTVAAVATDLGLPSISRSTAFACTDKVAMIVRLKRAGVPVPRYSVAQYESDAVTAVRKIGLPCILKPKDSSGSRGVILVTDYSQIGNAFRYASYASPSNEILIEEQLIGPEVSCEVFHDGQVIHVLSVTDKQTSGPPHFVETGHSQPSALSGDTIARIKDVAIKAVEGVNINLGAAHVEIIVTRRGPVVVELGARLGGDCITSHLVPLSTGVNVTELVLLQAVGLPVMVPDRKNEASAILFIEPPGGKIVNVNGLSKALQHPCVVEATVLKQDGGEQLCMRSSADRVGYIIAKAETASKALAACETALRQIAFEVVQ